MIGWDERNIDGFAAVSDHAKANAELLERAVNRLLGGVPPEDLGREVELIGIMMQRRT